MRPLDIVNDGARALVLCFKVWCVKMQVGNNPDAMFKMVKNKYSLGKAEDRKWQPDDIFLGYRQAFEAGYGLVSQVADGPTMEARQFAVRDSCGLD